MMIDRLEADHLRIIDHASVALSPGLNIFVGPNGAGKTTMLEAAHLLVRGKSFRRGSLEALIHYDQTNLAVRGRFKTAATGAFRLDFHKSRGEPVELQMDRRRVERISEISAHARVQLFLPRLAELVYGAPLERRQWLDAGLVHDKPESLKALAHFRHVLRQRNAALRSGQVRQLDAWDFELCASADAITELRQACFESMAVHVNECAAELCPEVPISLGFYSGYGSEKLADSLAKQRSADVKLRMTHSGPHRADIRIRTRPGNGRSHSASPLLSRGQARAVAASLRLGQAMYLLTRNKPSMLLIDDLGSEMDDAHCGRLLGMVKQSGLQVLATAINLQGLPVQGRNQWTAFEMLNGKIQDQYG